MPTEILITIIFSNLQQNVGLFQVQTRTSEYLDSQLLNCDPRKFPCLPKVANRTSHPLNYTNKIVAENNCLQSNHCINPIISVHSAGVLSITEPLKEQQRQNNVLNPAAASFLPNHIASQSNGIAAHLQFRNPVNSPHSLASTFPVNKYVAQPGQLCINQFVPGSQVPSNFQAPLTSKIHALMFINQPLNPVGQSQLGQLLVNQSLLSTVSQPISSVQTFDAKTSDFRW